jgi:hypothetical protein
MKTYRIAEVLRGPPRWVVISTNEDGSQDWGTMHQTEEAAQSEADRLMSLTLDVRDRG